MMSVLYSLGFRSDGCVFNSFSFFLFVNLDILFAMEAREMRQ